MQRIIEGYFKFYSILENNKFLSAIKRSFIMLVPVFMIGAFVLLIQYFPITPIREFISTALNGTIYDILSGVYYATFGLVSVYLVFTLSFTYSKVFSKNEVIRFFACINSLICYFVSLGPVVLSSGINIFKYTNMCNVFSALLISLTSVHLFFLFSDLFLKLFEKKQSMKNDLHIGLYSIFSIVLSALIFAIITALIGLVPDVNNFNDLVVLILSKPFESLGATFGGGILILFFQSILWLFGIHGSNVFETINSTIFAHNGSNIVSKNFIDCFVLLGGCGSSLCLLIAIAIFSKNKDKKKISYSAAGPMLFNVNEIMVLGLPIVLNPIYAIPFILTPIICFMVAYFFVAIGLCPQIINPDVQWTTPILLSGYQATGSIVASFIQLINVAIGVCIYFPFVKLDDYFTKRYSNILINQLTEYTKKCEDEHNKTEILSLDSRLSMMGESLLVKLENDILNDNVVLYYQPQYKDGQVVSLEGLLRFKYLDDNYVYPPLIVNLALEKQLFAKLSMAIVKRAIIDTKEFLKINPRIKVAINLRLELLIDSQFMNWFYQEMEEAKLPDYCLGIEFTEDSYLPSSVDLSPTFKLIHEKKINILLDDFSMGYTSIAYLQKNHFDYVKLDGSLINNIQNERSRNIISSIIGLGMDLGFEVIAEYVETEEQKELLTEMGCKIIQGYLYSKAIPSLDVCSKLVSKKE